MDSNVQLGIGSALDVVRAIWRRKLTFAAVAAALFVASCAFVLSLSPRYRAEALILLPQTPMGSLGEGVQRVVVATDPVTMRSEVDILTSSGIAQRVIDTLDLGNDPEFAPKDPGLISGLLSRIIDKAKGLLQPQASDEAVVPEHAARAEALMSAYKQRLSVFNDGRSLIVQIGFTAARPELASRVVNAHTQAYLDAQVERRVGGQQLAIQWLRTELDGRAKELREADEAVQTYRAKHNLIPAERAGQQRESLADQELRQVHDQLVGAWNDVTRERSRLAQLDESAETGTAAPTLDAANNPILVKLRTQEAEASSTLARLKGASLRGTVVATAQAELDSIRKTIREEYSRLRAGTKASMQEAEGRAEMFTQRMKEATQKRVDLDQASVEMKGLETYASAKRSIYEIVLSRYNTLLSERGFNVADAKIISSATIPSRPAFPKTGLFLGIALLFSTTAAAGLAFVIEQFAGGVRNLRAHCAALGVDVLGVVPIVGRRLSGLGSASQNGEYHQFWERIRGIRNRIVDLRDREGQVILITSAFPQEGKSVFAVAFARAVASTGIETILIDGDLRRPSVASRVGVGEVSKGISEVLSSRIHLRDAIMRTDKGNLALLPAIAGQEAEADALATENMMTMLRQLKRDYRVIVMDSPPLAATSDALSLAALADKTIVVTRAGQASNASVTEVVQMLRTHHGRLAGLVLVGEDCDEVSLGSRLGHYYPNVESPSPGVSRRRGFFGFARSASGRA